MGGPLGGREEEVRGIHGRRGLRRLGGGQEKIVQHVHQVQEVVLGRAKGSVPSPAPTNSPIRQLSDAAG